MLIHEITNRVCLLGLDEMYRDAIGFHERNELLASARVVAKKLKLAPADVPVEGYYARDANLAEYFRLMRALQMCDSLQRPRVAKLAAFRQLERVASSPIFGTPSRWGLLPRSVDALARALDETAPRWGIAQVVDAAARIASHSGEWSLVAVAALAHDAVTLAATRESVVLYAAVTLEGAFFLPPPEQEFVWLVDADVSDRANQFITAFNELFDDALPSAEPKNAQTFWSAYERSTVIGRCVYIGVNPDRDKRYYHWAIHQSAERNLEVVDFWASEVWTTDRFSKFLTPEGLLVKMPS